MHLGDDTAFTMRRRRLRPIFRQPASAQTFSFLYIRRHIFHQLLRLYCPTVNSFSHFWRLSADDGMAELLSLRWGSFIANAAAFLALIADSTRVSRQLHSFLGRGFTIPNVAKVMAIDASLAKPHWTFDVFYLALWSLNYAGCVIYDY